MYSGALRTFHRWYECRVAGSASSAHAAMPSEIGARRDTQPDLSDRRASRAAHRKRPRWNKRSRLLLRGVIRSTDQSRLYPSAYESLPILTNDTWARPENPSARAPAVVISITLPRAKGPLSVIVTTTLRPFA
jgi:hypothetical protein